MIDLHNHCLYGVDDGSQSLEESVALLKEAEADGVTEIVLTPHFIRTGEYKAEAPELTRRFEILKSELDRNHIYVELHLGNELYIHSSLDTLLAQKRVFTLNATHYVLVEFPFNHYKTDYDEILYNLTVAGYHVIIAHPERYQFVLKDISFCQRWLEHGYLLQCNQNGFFQKETRDQVNEMVELGYVQLISTDCHNQQRPCVLSQAYQEVIRMHGFKKAVELFETNPQRVLNDQPVKLQVQERRRKLLKL